MACLDLVFESHFFSDLCFLAGDFFTVSMSVFVYGLLNSDVMELDSEISESDLFAGV